MSAPPTSLDLVLAFTIVLLGLPEFALMPALKRSLARGSTTARPLFYGIIVACEWLFTGAIATLWLSHGRSWDGLFLGFASPWRVALGCALMPLPLWIAAHNRNALANATPERLERLRAHVGAAEFLLPHTAFEYRFFQVVSVTAGICEELVYRGFVTWVAASYFGMPAAVAVQSVIFGLGHVYQGNDLPSVGRAFLRTGAAGLILSLIALASGSLIPGMILHALMDLSSGDVAFRLYKRLESEELPTAGRTLDARRII